MKKTDRMVSSKTLISWSRRLDGEVNNLEKLWVSFESNYERCGRKIVRIQKEIQEIIDPTVWCPWDSRRIKESDCPGFSECKYRHDTCKEKVVT